MKKASFILAMAGHVDHGKSALVRALTGIDPDRLPEEKARGITIDLGFAHLRLAGSDFEIDVGIVDVPGHEDFVRNMVAGVGSVDAALLVVAADDGWMPQTEEHLQILLYQGVRHGIVALTKSDLLPDRSGVIAEIRQRLQDTPLAKAAIIETSVKSGEGLDQLRDAMRSLFVSIAPQPDVQKPRLAIDRSFEVKGTGTVVTGTLAGGSLGRGQSIVVLPGQLHARARGIQTHGADIETGIPGSRVAINLAGAEIKHGSVSRGDVVSIEGVGVLTSTIDVSVTRLDRHTVIARILNGSKLVLHHGTAWRLASVRFFEGTELRGGQRTVARLTLNAPLCVMAQDRLILRDASQRHTLGGAIVLDPLPPRARRGSRLYERQINLLRARASESFNFDVFLLSQVQRDSICSIDELNRVLPFARAVIQSAISAMVANQTLLQISHFILHPGWWAKLVEQIGKDVDEHHTAHPQDSGMPLAVMRKRVSTALPARAVVALDGLMQGLLEGLSKRGYVAPIGKAILKRTDHTARLPDRLRAVAEKVRQRLIDCPFDPPSLQKVAGDDASRQALRFLIAAGDVVELSSEVIISADAYTKAAVKVRNHIADRGAATVSELKQLLGSSRRIMVPLLEQMDKDRITQREGDRRRLFQSNSFVSTT